MQSKGVKNIIVGYDSDATDAINKTAAQLNEYFDVTIAKIISDGKDWDEMDFWDIYDTFAYNLTTPVEFKLNTLDEKSNAIDELYEWLNNNKIEFTIIDPEVIEIDGFGKVYFQNTEKSSYNSIFRKDKDGEYIFNSMEEPSVLMNENINYIAFKFGDNFYYYDMRQEFKLNILKYVGKRKPTQRATEFVNLGVHTPFELLNGSFMPQMWVQKAKYLGHKAIGICDKNTMASCFTLQKNVNQQELPPSLGIL